MNDKRFVDQEELVGRTVAKVAQGDNAILILFTDGTFTRIGVGGGDGWYTADTQIEFDGYTDDEELAQLGIAPLQPPT